MAAGKLLWKPDPKLARKTRIASYLSWLENRGIVFEDYQDLWKWSVDDLEAFWATVWKYFNVSDADYIVLEERKMPGATWFAGSDVNFAQRVFAAKQEGVAIDARTEGGRRRTMTWDALEKKTAALASRLREMGVAPGDRVAAYIHNGVEAVTGLLACASIGAVWSSCSPDFGVPAVIDRLGQVSPKVLIASDGYEYHGKWFDRTEEARKISASLQTVEKVIEVQAGEEDRGGFGSDAWDDVTSGKAAAEYEPLPFDQPLWILYSSGTTGLPKPIVHSQGGVVVELLKELSFHNDVRPGDQFFWFTTTGWMMWNYLVGGLLHGATIVLYSGSPGYPDLDALWRLAEDADVTFLGTSAAFLSSCVKAGTEPASTHRLSKLRGVGSTGSPLSKECFQWVYSKAKPDVWLASISGGTDVCTAFVGGCPMLPVYSGEIQCRCLGAKVEAFDSGGMPLVGQTGELVITEPMPSMPVFLWGDKDGSRYRESYFSTYPGVWRHGDWIEITERGTCVIHGRSDATLKRHGVRMGTSEIYRAVEAMTEVVDSLAIDLGGPGEESRLALFVTLAPGRVLDRALESKISERIRTDLSPRHVPDAIVQAPAIPRTINGKKLEVPVKRILMGADPDVVLNRGSLADTASVDFYVGLSKGGWESLKSGARRGVKRR